MFAGHAKHMTQTEGKCGNSFAETAIVFFAEFIHPLDSFHVAPPLRCHWSGLFGQRAKNNCAQYLTLLQRSDYIDQSKVNDSCVVREKPLGQRLRAARDASGLSQERLAARAGVSRETVRRLEHSANEGRVTTILKLAKALDVPVAALLGEEAGAA